VAAKKIFFQRRNQLLEEKTNNFHGMRPKYGQPCIHAQKILAIFFCSTHPQNAENKLP
jgi:hypothetical protein